MSVCSSASSVGSFVLMLHSHMPYVKKAGMWPFGEENLYEAIAETYIPLLNTLNKLLKQGIQPKIMLGLTPILCEQLADPYLQEGFVAYVKRQIAKANQDAESFSAEPDKQKLAVYYKNWYQDKLDAFVNVYQQDLLSAFSSLQQQNVLEIVTSAATHAFLPLLSTEESLHLQLSLAQQSYQKYFGQASKGFWLPECAYRPGLERYLEQYGFGYTFTEHHALEGASSTNVSHGLLPETPFPKTAPKTYEGQEVISNKPYWLGNSKIAVLARNNVASYQVWSSTYGYPGDGQYREFYKQQDQSGLRYWRLTDKATGLDKKETYDPEQAQLKLKEHALHFVDLLEGLLEKTSDGQPLETDEKPVITCAFDTELFGHWWFEGVDWLEEVLLELAGRSKIKPALASEAIKESLPTQNVQLGECTWGEGGHFWVWKNHQTEWLWQNLYEAEKKLRFLLATPQKTASLLLRQAAEQAIRELALLQSSDWPFLITTYQAKDYAQERFNVHYQQFCRLIEAIEVGEIDAQWLETLMDKDICFSGVSLDALQQAFKPSLLTVNQ